MQQAHSSIIKETEGHELVERLGWHIHIHFQAQISLFLNLSLSPLPQPLPLSLKSINLSMGESLKNVDTTSLPLFHNKISN